MEAVDLMKQNAGTCIFPVGDCKQLCGAITLLGPKGEHLPFCAKHQREVEKIFKAKQGNINRKSHHLKGQVVFGKDEE